MLLKDKNILILGVANHRSIAWGVAKFCHEQGANLCLTYQNERMKAMVEKVVNKELNDPWLLPCDVTNEEEVTALFAAIGEKWDHIDGLVHSLAFANRDDLKNPFYQTSRDGFLMAQEISSYSLVSLARGAKPLLKEGSSVICMSYLGGERVVSNYNVMGVAKSSLEMAARYLASELGPDGIRVNTLSPGPIKTLAASGVSGFGSILDHIKEKAPLRRNTSQEEVGKVAGFLLSDLSVGVTGELIHVDCGYHIMG